MVKDRIKQGADDRVAVIELTEEEQDLYTGAGLKIARFENGALKEFFDPMDLPEGSDLQDTAEDAQAAAVAWLAEAEGETWLVMCSGYQLCDPEPVGPMDAAKIGRMFGDMFARNEF